MVCMVKDSVVIAGGGGAVVVYPSPVCLAMDSAVGILAVTTLACVTLFRRLAVLKLHYLEYAAVLRCGFHTYSMWSPQALAGAVQGTLAVYLPLLLRYLEA